MEAVKEDTQKKILEAARGRFRRYGYTKTSMSEIAGDCDMSTSNIYRFFKNKEAVISGIAQQFFALKEEIIRHEVRKAGVSSAQRLENMVIANLTFIYNEFSDSPHTSELVDYVHSKHFDMIKHHMEVETSLVAEILAQGNESGEFDVGDVVATAELVKMATARFCSPPDIAMMANPKCGGEICSYDDMEKMARGVVRMIVKGLEKR